VTDYRPPKRTPSQVSHLERLLESYSRATGVAPNRLRRWMTMMVMIGALDRVQADPEQPLFLVKGGVAMELRLRQGARATRDLDMVFLGDPAQLLAALDAALAEPYSLFTFERGPAEPIGTTSSQRLDVKVAFNGRSWATERLEISPPEGRSGSESQLLEAISIEDFGLVGPEKVRCLSIRYQIAQKLHACTETFATGRENDRFRDLIDLLLLRALDPDLTAIRHACVDIFASRATHSWPPAQNAPSSWAEPYARLARDLEFAIGDLDEAATLVAEFIAEIDEAVDITPPPPRPGQTWRRADGVRVEIQEADSTGLVVNQFDPANGTTVVNAIDPHDVERMVLVTDRDQPLWLVTVIGSFNGPAHAALLRVGEVAGASSLRVTGGQLTGPMLDATIVARDEATARALAKSVLPAGATVVAVAKSAAGKTRSA
jgi:hypothetical protein